MKDRAMRSFDKAAELLGLDADIKKILAETASEIVVNFPVKMDDGRIDMFTGYRVQHNNVLGPFYGGLRYHPAVDLSTMRALAMKRTLQMALMDIPFGGAMGGIQFDPSERTITELERITRRFAFALGNNIGPEYDIPAPDMNTGPQIMAWIQDTYLSTVPPQLRQGSIHVVTGKPFEAGGSRGRDKAAAQGIVFLIEQWAEETGFDLTGATYSIQGFGNVGSWTCQLLKRRGLKLVAVEDVTSGYRNPDGIDPDDLLNHRRRHASIYGYPNASRIDRQTFPKTKADILILAALENQITTDLAPAIDVKLIAEGANGAIDPDAEDLLKSRGISILPDIICNSGGPIVSYFEWLQNKRGERWELEEVDSKMRKRIIAAWGRMKAAAREKDTDARIAGHILALSALERVYKDRGIFP